MQFHEWLDAKPGRAAQTARHFKVSEAAVNQWRTNGVPVGRMKAIRSYTRNKVTLEEMVPDAKEEGATGSCRVTKPADQSLSVVTGAAQC